MTFGFKAGRMRAKAGAGLGSCQLPWEDGGPTNQRVDANSTLKARHAPLFCTLQGALLFPGYNAVNEARIPGCVAYSGFVPATMSGFSVGHGPHSMGLHVARETLLGKKQGVSGTFSENS